MRKVLIFTMVMVTSLFISPNLFAIANELPQSKWSIQSLDKKSGGTLQVEWNKQTNTPSLLTGALSRPSKHSPEWITYEFLKQVKSIYGLRNPNRDIKIIKVERSHDIIHVHIQRLLFGTPVWGDLLVVSMDIDGVIRRVEGTIHPDLEKQLYNRPMHPAFSKKKAVEKAKAGVQWELANEPKVETYYLTTLPGTPLIYVVQLQYRTPDRRTTTMIHSLSGRIIEHKNHE
ncbi:MAG: hypothetical protein WD424_05395 [Paenibacillaceae bacterium]